MTLIETQILEILEQHLSGLIARSVLRRSAAALAIAPGDLEEGHIPALVPEIERGIRLFVHPVHQATLIAELRELGPPQSASETTVAIESEADVRRARSAARTVALDLGANTFSAQKIVTAVSELARNIALYAGSGKVAFIPERARRNSLRIVASDTGPGIGNIDVIFSGKYRSKTGLGRGLMGVRRMADDFDVDTCPSGTTIRVEFLL